MRRDQLEHAIRAATEIIKQDSVIGEWPDFHQRHGFHMQGAGRKSVVLSEGWTGRLIAFSGGNSRK